MRRRSVTGLLGQVRWLSAMRRLPAMHRLAMVQRRTLMDRLAMVPLATRVRALTRVRRRGGVCPFRVGRNRRRRPVTPPLTGRALRSPLGARVSPDAVDAWRGAEAVARRSRLVPGVSRRSGPFWCDPVRPGSRDAIRSVRPVPVRHVAQRSGDRCPHRGKDDIISKIVEIAIKAVNCS